MLRELVGAMKRDQWDPRMESVPFLFNAIEQTDALHVVFGQCFFNIDNPWLNFHICIARQ